MAAESEPYDILILDGSHKQQPDERSEPCPGRDSVSLSARASASTLRAMNRHRSVQFVRTRRGAAGLRSEPART